MNLYQVLAQQVDEWRKAGYPHEEYPVIGEILDWASNPDGGGFRLRVPQLRALETYWFLRLVKDTPHIIDLYKEVFPKTRDLLDGLGIPTEAFEEVDFDQDDLFEKIKTDDEFTKRYKFEALRETLTLDYPSYILALAMGAGKTILIGAIFASEFAMSLEYPEGPFVQNALVFAPGKTIIEALRELAETPFDRILPERLYKPFAASVKLTFTRDGVKEIPVIPGSYFNVIVTNTEKIRIQKDTIRKGDLGPLFAGAQEDEAKQEVANARLIRIASLPHLGIFSDEAHHTYGQSLDKDLKRVRQTVDYLAENTNVIGVINTTGTPYYKSQLLRDVVVWYGLSEGIRDGILKEVSGSIYAYDFEDDIEAYLSNVIENFFTDYGDVTLPDGTPAKLAIFFPQTNDVTENRPIIEAKLAEMGLPQTLILEHHTANNNQDGFDRFRTRNSPHRIALLVNRGVEGWNVPPLFACALARKLTGGKNNFVLQASSRCLRQIPGNTTKARIYLSIENQSILDKQLRETYNETIDDLNRSTSKSRPATITVRKLDIPPLVVEQIVRSVVRKENANTQIKLEKPEIEAGPELTRTVLTIARQSATEKILMPLGDEVEIETQPDSIDLYTAAVELAAIYRLDVWLLHEQLQAIADGANEIPLAYLDELGKQIEAQTRNYEIIEETQEKALALIKLDGFDQTIDADGAEVYTAEITYPVDKSNLLVRWEEWQAQAGQFGFHYSPYNFDSNPEKSFLEMLLRHIDLHPEQVEDIYFTGALTDPKKTDFYIEYRGEDERMHRYTPDFIIRRKDDKCLIVEIKSAQFEKATNHDFERSQQGEAAITVEGRKAVAARKWETLNPDKLKYEIIFTKEALGYNQTEAARDFVEGEG